jgi:glycosyltransferase involved in cell wall biosynthesis
VLYVGRLSFEKNLNALLTAHAALCAESGERAQLVLVGDGPARASLERETDPRHVTFTGYLRGEALATAYASADVFAFPSLTETFGQVVQEAMASGLPVVAFEAEGVRDLIRHGESGLLAPIGDVAAFTRALRALLSSPEQRERMGAHGRASAEQRGWDRVMDELVLTYERVIAAYNLARVA